LHKSNKLLNRYKGITKIKQLYTQLEAMDKILKQIKSDKEQAAQQKSVNTLKDQMNAAITKIKVTFIFISYLLRLIQNN
jgi:hypothetical protein